ncbi:hypothetical protein PBI_TOAKA_3 [Mycobacterium phage Toaka]|nr:hypothetical protein PBI_TOAKA_3 [Mycobacterium phage Toaka]
MRANQAVQTGDKVRADIEYQIEHYLDNGDLLPPRGWPYEALTIEIAVALLKDEDPAAAIAAVWAAFESDYPGQ